MKLIRPVSEHPGTTSLIQLCRSDLIQLAIHQSIFLSVAQYTYVSSCWTLVRLRMQINFHEGALLEAKM